MSREWKQNTKAPYYRTEWHYIDSESSRILSSISTSSFDVSWSVWKNGAGFGEFVDEQKARAEAERIADLVS